MNVETISIQTAHPGSPTRKNTPSRSRRIHLELTSENLAVITFDNPDKSANIFDDQTLNELVFAVSALESLEPKGVVFRSRKPSIFIAGADLDSLSAASKEQLELLIGKGQSVFQRIADLPARTVTAIHGACVGGGLELALACDLRIATDTPSTRIGLPETQLGILPGWGGSTRLPRLIGLPRALKAILGGKPYRARAAEKLGIVDQIVPKERLLEVAKRAIEEPLPARKRFLLTNNRLSAFILRQITLRKVLKKSRGNYPALEEATRVVSKGCHGSIQSGLIRERNAILRLARTDAAINLMRLFHLQEGARKRNYFPKVDHKSFKSVDRVAVIGSGVMGAGIAHWLAVKDHSVLLRDIDQDRIAHGLVSIRRLFKSGISKKVLSRHEAMLCQDRIVPSAVPVPMESYDLVMEAASEDLETKKGIFRDLCRTVPSSTILATNTSALPITELCKAPGISHPERIVGIHFFNPVSRMKLVEVITTAYTSPEVVERVLTFVRGIGKIPVVVKDSPGFLINRILMPYLIEAGHLVDLGYDPDYVDESMLDFGMPMGPLRLLDEIGLDVAAHVAATMRESFGSRYQLPRCLIRLVKEGNLGRKSGNGFYRHDATRGVPPRPGRAPYGGMTRHEVSIRLAYLMTDEAELCLAEGIARNADDIDLAMVLGTGFAPFHGGPLQWKRGQKNKDC